MVDNPVFKLWNETRSRPVAERTYRARSLWELAAGLLGRRRLRPGEALWLEPCGSIHTWGMGYAIDVVFLDREGTVIRLARSLPPWRIALAPPRTRSVVELPSGAAADVIPGERLALLPIQP
jgi:uncharacterized membrane protein (UPF0127 family)